MRTARALLNRFLKDAPLKADLFSVFNNIAAPLKDLESIAEDLESLNHIADRQELISIDPTTLNYTLNTMLVQRYRAVGDFFGNSTPLDFEHFCSLYLRLAGCSYAKVTPSTHDRGIDFLGIIRAGEYGLSHALGSDHFLVGQAKHTHKPVGPAAVREFYGAVQLLKIGGSSLGQLEPGGLYSFHWEKEMKPFSLVTPVFLSTSTLTPGAYDLCRFLGVKVADMVQLGIELSTHDHLFSSENAFHLLAMHKTP